LSNKKNSNNRNQNYTLYQGDSSGTAPKCPEPLNPSRKIANQHAIDTSHFLKNIQHVEANALQYASDFVRHVMTGSFSKACYDYFELLQVRFNWVYMHSVNVAVLSVMMAAELGYPQKELKCIALGGLLHDIGKLLIPTSIIQKNSSLDKTQMELMRKHCELGMSLVAGCGLCNDCTAMILQHHERLDGSGYPFGLKSDQIHSYAKIAMIADVLDAITSDRPYRPGKNVFEAIQIIKDEGPKFSVEYVSMLEKLFCRRSA